MLSPGSAPPPGVNHQVGASATAGSLPRRSRTRPRSSTTRTRAPVRSTTAGGVVMAAAYVDPPWSVPPLERLLDGRAGQERPEQLRQPPWEEPLSAGGQLADRPPAEPDVVLQLLRGPAVAARLRRPLWHPDDDD